MSGVIKKLYHPTNGGTVTTLSDPSLQELYPIVSTTGVIAPEGAFHANDNLDQILRWLDANKISGTGLKTLTINGVEQSLIGSGTIVINTGGGGGGGDSDFFELDASGNLHVKNDRGLYTGSFISAGGVGSGGGQGGDGNATSIMGYPIVIDSTHPLNGNAMLMFNNNDALNPYWEPLHPYRPVSIKKSDSTVVDVLNGYSVGTFFLKEGTGITLEKSGVDTIVVSSTGGTGGLPTAGQGLEYGTGADASTLKVKIGTGLYFSNGALCASGGGYTLPTASSSTKGGIKVGNSLTISNEILDINEANLRNGWMDLTTNQVVSTGALKRFVDGIALGTSDSNTITYDSVNGEFVINGNVKVNGNLYATGNVTAGLSSN